MAGEVLRKKREELGLEISQIADQLRIKKDYLSYIEQDLFEKLPVPVYTMGYIRSYARHLDVDPTAILEVYAKRLPQPKTGTFAIPLVLADKKRPVYLYILAALIVLGIGIGAYIVMKKNMAVPETKKNEAVHVPAPNIEKDLPPAKAGQSVPDMPVSKPDTSTPPTTVPDLRQKAAPGHGSGHESEPPKTASPESPSPKTVAVAVPEVKEKTSSASLQEKDMHTLVIKATETSWVSVKFRNGKYESMTLTPGSSRVWNFGESVWIKTGNAGGISLILDGKDTGPVGKSKEVVTLTLPKQPQ